MKELKGVPPAFLEEGGGGGGGPVTRKLVRAKSGPGGPLFAAKIGPTPDHFWLPNLVRVAKSGPGFINLHETSPCPVKFVYMVCC